MQMIMELLPTFCISKHFYYCVLLLFEFITAICKVTIQQFDRYRNFKASCETVRFLTLRYLIISKIQRSWRQFRDTTVIWSCQTSLETTIRGTQVSFRRSFIPKSFFACMLPWTGWVGAPKPSLSRGREALGTPPLEESFVFCSAFTSVAATC